MKLFWITWVSPISLKVDEGSRKGRTDSWRNKKTWPATAGFQDGGMGHKPKNVDGLQKLEESFSPRASIQDTTALTPPELAGGIHFRLPVSRTV